MMWTIFSLLAVLVLTWVWVIRGFFSAFLHLLCVLAAGAVAFAVYEPLATLLLTKAPGRGVGTILRDTAHGVSLGMSFAIALALLRVTVDKLVPANLKFNDNVEYVGAGVCGLATGILTVGFVLMSLSLMRFGPDKPVQSLVFTQEGGGARGSVVRNKSPLRPYVDEWTAGVYSWMSRGSLNTEQPLHRWHPNFHELGSAMRTSFDGRSRNASRPSEYRVVQWYALGDIDRGGNITELMRDRWQNVNQRVIGLDGQEITNGYVAGVVVEFDAEAREMGGGAKIVIGNAQVRLVAEQAGTGFTRAFHPSAVIAQAEGDDTQLARFRFDADETFIASVGGATKAIMVFDFALPRTYRPIAIYIRGVRKTIDPTPDLTFESTAQRDNAVPNFEHGGIDLDKLKTDYMVRIETMRGRQALTGEEYHLQILNTLPGRIQIKKGAERGLQTFKGDRDRFHFIVGGTEVFRTAELRGQFIAEANLRIAGFSQPTDVRIVQADVGRSSRLALNGQLYQNAQGSPAPMLVDDRGQQYPPVGYVAVEDANTYISFTPGQPIREFGSLPFTVSASRATQDVHFIYNVSAGVKIVAMVAGDQIVARWEPAVDVSAAGRR